MHHFTYSYFYIQEEYIIYAFSFAFFHLLLLSVLAKFLTFIYLVYEYVRKREGARERGKRDFGLEDNLWEVGSLLPLCESQG